MAFTVISPSSFPIFKGSRKKMPLILDFASEKCSPSVVGGKAHNLWKLGRSLQDCKVPPWFCLTTEAFQLFIKVGNE